jgi:outer membrane protein OmpA-like peptidoglycan-associated protein
MEQSDNTMIALRKNRNHLMRSGIAMSAFLLAMGHGSQATLAQTYGQTYQPSVEVNLGVLDSLGPAPANPALDLAGAATNQIDLYGTYQAPASAVSEESVLLLPAPDVAVTGSGSELLLSPPTTTATNDFTFPSVEQPVSDPDAELAPVTIVTPVATVEPMAEPEPEMVAVVEPEPEVMVVVPEPEPEPEPEVLIAVPETEVAAAATATVEADDDVFAEIDDLLSDATEPQDVAVPEPAMTMDGTDVAVVSTENAEMSAEDVRILFQPNDDSLTAEDESVLRGLAGRLDAEPDQRIQLRAYASSEGTSASDARRLALSRALAVRAFLIENNVRSTRIDVRALGDKAESGPLDRIDIVLVER